jgi:hypothetical protein
MKIKICLFSLFLLICSTMSCCKEEEDNLDINKLVAVWELDKFIDKNNNNLNVPKIQISFLKNNCVTVFTRYNFGQGEFSIKGNKVTIHNLTLSTRQYDLENDNRFVSNLTGDYMINGDTLRIISDNDFDMVLYKTQIVDPYQCDLSTMLIDSIENNRYYSEDIIDEEYTSIYGKWFVYSVYGGFYGGEEIPRFDFLEVKKNGMYGISKGFDLLEYGKIEIKKLTEEKLLLDFIPSHYSGDIRWSFVSVRLSFPVNDTLIFHDDCLDCYHYYLYRLN